jgi:osmotically-inducible protein OsmY
MKVNCSKMLIAATFIVLLANSSILASEMDERIESSARKSYVFKTYLKDDSIKIQSKDGNVILTGTIIEESHKELARETLENLPGVKNVDNQLVLKDKLPVENSDGWLALKVKTALVFHKSVNALKTEVYVKNGIVTLKGEAASAAQKDLAGEYAKDVAGIKDVKNDMTVAKDQKKSEPTIGEAIDDASITAQVKMALLSHHSTSALKTKVETTNGVVTLSGIAKNDAEKTLVSKLANDINGVTNVVNNMTIDVSLSQK